MLADPRMHARRDPRMYARWERLVVLKYLPTCPPTRTLVFAVHRSAQTLQQSKKTRRGNTRSEPKSAVAPKDKQHHLLHYKQACPKAWNPQRCEAASDMREERSTQTQTSGKEAKLTNSHRQNCGRRCDGSSPRKKRQRQSTIRMPSPRQRWRGCSPPRAEC